MVGESLEKKKPPPDCFGVVGAVCVPSASPSNQRRLLFRRFCLGLDREAPSPALDSASASASLSCASNRGSSSSDVGDSWPWGEPSWPDDAPPRTLRLRPCPWMGDARALSLPISDEACVLRSLPLPSLSSASHDCWREFAWIESELSVVGRANWTLFRSRGVSDSSPSVGCRDMGAKGG